MNRSLLCVAALLAEATGARAQYYLLDSNVWVTAQERARVEYRANNLTFDSAATTDTDWFLLNRARIGIGAKATDWVTIYGEAQDARVEFASLKSPGGSLGEDYLDFHQGWVELADYKKFPLGLKVGRQELSYGDERL
ncbi:MAG: alginate export family protein, partial [Gammaproteobacteria bacterium]